MDPDHRDELDEIIDRGLAAYSSCEPLAGLEDRVLNRIQLADAGRRRGPGWRWALAIPVLAALATVVVVSRGDRTPIAKPTQTARVDTAPPVTPVLPAAPSAVPSHTIRRTRGARPSTASPRVLPKRDQFPTPTPLSPEERALVALARLRPADVEAFAELQKKNSQEIQIPPIEIPPLRIDGNQ
jgi:hypothetical protein